MTDKGKIKITKAAVDDYMIETHVKIEVGAMLQQIIDKLGPKRALKLFGMMCMSEYMPHMTTMLIAFANERDEEGAKVAVIIKYIINRWDEIEKAALQHWKGEPPSQLAKNDF